MINEKMQKAFNDQINEEMFSAYLYLAMSAQFEEMALHGFAQWMKVQAQEEMVHAMKFYGHIIERGGRVQLKAIGAPQTEWDSTLAMFEAALEHEKHITACINKLVELGAGEKDYASRTMLQWFIDEQVEEEASAEEVVVQLRMIKDAPGAMYMLDREMGQRTFSPAEAGEGGA